MARPKGSKNKARTVKASVDYVAVIAEKADKKKRKSNLRLLRSLQISMI